MTACPQYEACTCPGLQKGKKGPRGLKRFPKHYETLPHTDCPSPEYCDCSCHGCMVVYRRWRHEAKVRAGTAGGPARAKALSAERRRAISRRGNDKRWATR